MLISRPWHTITSARLYPLEREHTLSGDATTTLVFLTPGDIIAATVDGEESSILHYTARPGRSADPANAARALFFC